MDPATPPPSSGRPHRVALKQFWNVVPAEVRQRTLATLSQIVAKHLPGPTNGQEVSHDRH